MNVTLTNRGAVALPYASSSGAGFAASIEPGISYTTDDAAIVVSVLGGKPSFSDELSEALQSIAELFGRLVTFWREHAEKTVETQEPVVRVSIENHGPNALRVILGDPTKDAEVQPGDIIEAEAVDYIELRELGV